ncbi:MULTISPECIES: hypothetical protein [unclassified Clostridium]|uniref:hypothetical protein n=1 Tax=unclassified Clostridium TaxID=2614128 RepID=UPI002079DFB1|nr:MULTISPECIES: hypothetical protein [unclassified Clostridium]
MARLDTTNVLATHFGGGHIESVVGKAKTGDKEDKQIQCGYVGKIGALVRDNIYEFLPLATGDPLYVIATPEVNAKDTSIIDRKIVNFVLEAGEVVDAVPIAVTDKISISEDGVVGKSALVGYLYTKAGEDKFQYSATATPSDAIHIFKIESIENATQGMVIGLGNTQMQLQYKMIKARRIA